MSPAPSALRIVLFAALLAIALQACGRRGPPEAPPEPGVPQPQRQTGAALTASQADDEAAEETLVPVPTAKNRRRGRGFTIPKEPFILDPLL